MTPVREALEPQYQQFRRTAIAEMTPWVEGFDMSRVSVSAPDKEAGSPKPGDMIARNPKNHDDKWLVAAAYFADNFAATCAPSGAHFTDADLDALFEASKRDVHFVGSEIRQLIGDIRTARAAAAPGEPCAVKPLVWSDHRPDSFPEPAWSAQTPFGFYNIEEVSASDNPAYVVRLHAHHFIADKDGLDEAKAAAQADYEQRIRSALVTTPQPAAGWDEAIEAAAKWHESEAAHAKVIYSEMDRYSDDHEERAGWRSYKDKEDRHLAYAAHMRTLSREAPAPAEGVIGSGTRVAMLATLRPFTHPDLRKFSTGNIDGNASVVFQRNDAELTIGDFVRASAVYEQIEAARPDTAEARLREALVDLHEAILALSKFGKNNVTLFEDSPLENQECFDAWLRLNTAQTKAAEVLGPPFKLRFSSGWLASKIKSDPDIETDIGKALSPPSGGDEAKESSTSSPSQS